eukprot:PhM_4_TR1617/c0_g1_i1/m.5206
MHSSRLMLCADKALPSPKNGVLTLLRREIGVAARYYRHRANTNFQRLLGYPEVTEREAQVRENKKVLQQEFAQAEKEHTEKMSWGQYGRHVYETMFSPRAAEVQLLQQCSQAHAAEIAVELGVDVRSVKVQFESVKQSDPKAVKDEQKVVAYIDAPQATEEEMEMVVSRIRKECPMAQRMGDGVEWRRW